MKKVTLYDLKTEQLKVNVVAYINDKGDLQIDGYDIGQTVKDLKGSSDYEYFLTVVQEQLHLLINLLETDEDALLEIIQQKFNGNYAFSEFKTFLKENEIPFKQFYWS